MLLPLRHPSVVAKEFASLDYVSGGRTILGVGVGGESGPDFDAVGVSPRERGARTDDAMRALRALFSERPASYEGRFFSFAGISIEPPPGAARRPAALGRRPLGGGDPARGDPRRRLDPDLGLGGAVRRRRSRSCPGA